MTDWPLWLALALGGLGLYCRLIAPRVSSHPALPHAGSLLGGTALLLLAALAWKAGAIWPAPLRMTSGSRIVLSALLAGILLASGAAVTSSRSAPAGLWLAVALAGNAALWAWLGLHWTAWLAGMLATGGLALSAWWLAWTAAWDLAAPAQHHGDGWSVHEPALACMAGVLLAGSLAGAVHDSYAAHRDVAIEPAGRPAGERVHHLLIGGALVVAVGGIGFSSGGGEYQLAIAVGIVLQGIVLTCAASALPRHDAGGRALSVAALFTVVLEVSVLLILFQRGGLSSPGEAPSTPPLDRTRGLHGRG